MRLAAKLSWTFGVLSSITTLSLGFTIRESWLSEEKRRFEAELAPVCDHFSAYVRETVTRDRRALERSCAHGSLVDRASVARAAGTLDGERLALSELVASERKALAFDELALVTDRNEVLAADPKTVFQTARATLPERTRTPVSLSRSNLAGLPVLSYNAHCRSDGLQGVAGGGSSTPWVGLVASSNLESIVSRFAESASLGVRFRGATFSSEYALKTCTLDGLANVPFSFGKSHEGLERAMASIDQRVVAVSLFAVLAALLASALLARGIARPIATLAEEAKLVADGRARPVDARGAKEIEELAASFSRMLADLTLAREKLEAATRIAAWREVAKRVAHEIKNPLAPIRAAVETLRRLRARNDAAFDEYFDEASRTVLDEVQRITTIASEFAHFARLPAPQPSPTDVRKILADQIRLAEGSGNTHITVSGPDTVVARVDRDQIAQILTNLLGNAREAGTAASSLRDGAAPGAAITVRCALGVENGALVLRIEDDGPGVPSEMESRLFEPYATSKKSGTGLGLAISQRIALDHGGSLRYLGAVRKEAPRGAVFELRLPLEGPATPG